MTGLMYQRRARVTYIRKEQSGRSAGIELMEATEERKTA
jgi:hypothetical protein